MEERLPKRTQKKILQNEDGYNLELAKPHIVTV